MKFGISFTRKTMNQANALVNGLRTARFKFRPAAPKWGRGWSQSYVRSSPISSHAAGDVRIMPTSTEKNNNTSPSAASASTDLARRHAGVQSSSRSVIGLMKSLPRCRSTNQIGNCVSWTSSKKRTNSESISGSRGFYATPGVDFNRETGQGTPFLYYTYGAAVAEVLIDRFTGELKVERVDLLIDLGSND